MSIIIRHVEGSLKGREQTLELEPGNTILLGRHPDCDIVFDPHQDIAASGRHARLRLDHAGRVWIEDIGSSNGTFVDGDEVGDSVELEDGSLVELGAGGPKFTVSVASAPDDMPATIAMSSVGGEGPPPDPQPGSAEHNAPSPPPEEDAGQGDDSDGKVGARTVAIMIEKAQTQSSKKFTAIIAGLAVLVFACIGVIVFLAVRGEVKDKAQEDELEKTREELASTREELENTRDEMQSRLEAERNKQSAHQLTSRLQQRQQFNNQLEQARVEVTDEMREEFEESQKALVETLTNVETTLNERYGNSLYMLGFSPDPDVLRNKYAAKPREDRPGFDEGFCTAFAITPDGWLATNAHCINALFKVRWDMARRGVPATYFAKRNNDSETVYPIKIDTAVLHPGYTHAASADVGLLQIDLEAAGKQSVDNHVWLASGTQAQELSVGQPIYTLGFPGKVMAWTRTASSRASAAATSPA